MTSEAIKMYKVEFSNNTHNSVTTRQEKNAPTMIAKNACHIFKFVNPAIKLPAYTPVNGKGTATNMARRESL